MKIIEKMKRDLVIFDGAMGTQLIERGLKKGECPEIWNIERPEIIKEIHRNYFEAGADVVLTNTFGGSSLKLSFFKLQNMAREINIAGASLAVEVKPEGKFVGGDIGPTGMLLKPYGPLYEKEAEQSFMEQAKALADGGVDFIIIETMSDLREALSALRGAKSATSLPVFVSITYKATPKGFYTIMGNSVTDCVRALEDEGADAIGTNCNLGSKEMHNLIKEIKGLTNLPVFAEPNAGNPFLNEDGTTSYEEDPDYFAEYVFKIFEAGANGIGGCCGTTPLYIKKIVEKIRK
ncbi:MAG: homocysteine S-methyltransferase family protein [Candidatus Aminicenantia bacterium]